MIPVGTMCLIVDGEAYNSPEGDDRRQVIDYNRIGTITAIPSKYPGYVCELEDASGHTHHIEHWALLRPITPPPQSEPAPPREVEIIDAD